MKWYCISHDSCTCYINSQKSPIFHLLWNKKCDDFHSKGSQVHCLNIDIYFIVICLHINDLIIIIMETHLKELNTWNVCQVYSVECVSKIKSILSIIVFMQYMSLGIFSTPICLVMIVIISVIYVIIIITLEVCIIIYCLGLDHETMACTVCFVMFLYLYMQTIKILHLSYPLWYWNHHNCVNSMVASC